MLPGFHQKNRNVSSREILTHIGLPLHMLHLRQISCHCSRNRMFSLRSRKGSYVGLMAPENGTPESEFPSSEVPGTSSSEVSKFPELQVPKYFFNLSKNYQNVELFPKFNFILRLILVKY